MAKISIKEARINAGVTRTAAAKKLGVTPDTLYRWETKGDKYSPTAAAVKTMTQIYQINVSDLDLF
jgi:DNA-binding XRE family transcriptional regulator